MKACVWSKTKPCFLRFRGIPNTDYLEIVFVYSFQLSFSAYFLGFYVLFGVQGLPKGLPEGTLRSRKIVKFSAKIELWFPEGPQGGFGVPKVSILDVIWECFGTRF